VKLYRYSVNGLQKYTIIFFSPSNVQILTSALVLQPTSVTLMPGVQTLKVLTAVAVSGALKGTAKTAQVKSKWYP